MLLTRCGACRFGFHESCEKGHPSPPGVMGGWKCICTHGPGEPVERMEFMDALNPARDAIADPTLNIPDAP